MLGKSTEQRPIAGGSLMVPDIDIPHASARVDNLGLVITPLRVRRMRIGAHRIPDPDTHQSFCVFFVPEWDDF